MARRESEFLAIRSEGGLLPPDLLRRILDPAGKLDGTLPRDYGLPEGERLSEVITQSWNRLRKHWVEFRAALAGLAEGEAGTGLTNDKWSLPLLRELGFGLLPTTSGPELNGRTYAISRFFGPVPIHLVGAGLSLDRKAAGQRGAATSNPHGLVQEFLNRSPGHLWAIVGNGLRLRVLRDNQALSRQSFLEFDLAAMFDGEVYSDFVLLWLVAHATRFAPREGARPDSCWLEDWTKEAETQGTRALGDLRGGVERALQILGEGFTGHPRNASLRDALRSGELPLSDFHGQLLRVVYRLIFLFVAEDRVLEGQPLLHPRDESDAAKTARQRFADHYGTARLRHLAGAIKGSRHGDLWRQLQLLVGALSGETAFEGTRQSLALPSLGSFLWSPDSTTALNRAELTNYDLLEALRHLAYTRQGRALRPVDYRNLGAEELGGVYESLLALTPQISADGASFTFAEFAGNERKTSGSYYTPDVLVQCLLDSTLDPVVSEAIQGKSAVDAENAILALKVCDPAVGSGHFLVGAAHRLARHLARARAQAIGESEPSPPTYQHALRDVIGRCLYGVDINPMAAELCRVGLWLEALEPGKPLSFLDHHVRVGNSLLGGIPELIAAGIPDDAFAPIGDDDGRACTLLKKRNRAERSGVGPLFAQQDADTLARLRQAAAHLDDLPDERPEDVRAKELAFRRHEETDDFRQRKRIADAWCASFVARKWFAEPGRDSSVSGLTQGSLNALSNGSALPGGLTSEIERLARHYQFFHWHLAFPEVFAKGGFDCVCGNPPWEMLEVENGAVAPEAFARLQLCYKSNQYALLNGRRDLYKLFLLNCARLPRPKGRMGFLTPLGVFIEEEAADWRKAFFDNGSVLQLRHFQNGAKQFFHNVHASYRFCAVVFSPHETSAHEFSTVARAPSELPQQYFVKVPREEFDLWLGPSRAATIYPEDRYALTHRVASRTLAMSRALSFRVVAEFHPSSDKGVLVERKPPTGWAVLKNRNIHFFTHAYAPHESWVDEVEVKARLRRKGLDSSAWLDRFVRLVFRDIARNDDERTLIACLAPPGAVSTYDTPMFVPQVAEADYPKCIACYCAVLSSFLFDFLIRPFVDKHIKGYTLARVAWPALDSVSESFGLSWMVSRVVELAFTEEAFRPFARDCGWAGPPFDRDEWRRFLLRCELDAALFSLFLPADAEGRWSIEGGVVAEDIERLAQEMPSPREAVGYIMDSFPIVRRKDEEQFDGAYMTKLQILKSYDAMLAARSRGEAYQTELSPVPGDWR